MLKSYESPLDHSINWEETQKICSKSKHYKHYTQCIILSCGTLITEFPGDCGCLIIKYALYLNPELIQQILDFASLSGYSKIICTLSTEYTIDPIKQFLKDFGFKIQYTGKSNRSKAKTYLCYKIIKPTTIGY